MRAPATPSTPVTSLGRSVAHAPNVTTIGSYVTVVLSALESRGVSRQSALREIGLDRTPTNDPLDRVSIEKIRELLAFAVAATNDPYFGLYAADFMRVTTLHALG